MTDISRTIAKGLFYFVALVLLLWTSSLTVSFVQGALPAAFWIVPYLALIVFDGGQVAWLWVFLHYAEGAGQRAVAIVTCLFDFTGVGLMVVAEILLGGQTLAAAPDSLGTYAIWGVGVWTVVNVGAVIAFHLLAPEARVAMAMQSEQDAVFNQALEKLKQMRVNHSSALADQLAAGMMSELITRMNVDNDGDGIPDVHQPSHPAPLLAQQTAPTPPAVKPNSNGAGGGFPFRGRYWLVKSDIGGMTFISQGSDLGRMRQQLQQLGNHHFLVDSQDENLTVIAGQEPAGWQAVVTNLKNGGGDFFA